ncbi:MAG TPA: hypothetical protein VGG44_10170 [Tepidisphaeraceae bacterium]|jgi:hypothetical protein
MKRVCSTLAATILCIALATSFASAQVLKQIPSNALVFLKVSDLEATSKKISDLATSLGLAQMIPDMADPLGSLMKQIGVTDGVNRDGDMAFVYVDPDTAKTPSDKSVLLLLPVSDYQKFIANFPDAKPDGDLTQVHFHGETDITYLNHWGDFVAASPSREIVATAPTDVIQVDGLGAKELDGKDFVIFGNLKALRPKMLDGIAKLRTQAPEEIDKAFAPGASKFQGIDPQKFAPLAKVAAAQFLNVAQDFAQGADAASFSLNLSPDGIATTMMCQFAPGSSLANRVTAIKNTDDSLLSGLGEGKYLIFGGSNPGDLSKPLADFLAPIQAAITDLGPDYSSLNDWLNSVEKMAAASKGATGGLLMPTAQPGQGSLVEVVAIRHGDAKALMDATHAMSDAQQAAIKALGIKISGMGQTYVPNAKTVDGVSFDELKSEVNMNGKTPQEMQVAQIMTMVYGPLGPSAFIGIVDDSTFLTVMGLDDAAISAAIAAAKAGDDPMAKTSAVKSVAAQLPPQRFGVCYVPLDLWATTGFGYARMFGIDMGVTMPENLPPMGTTLSTDGTAIRADTYLPSQLTQALAAAGMQVYMKTQNVGQQPPQQQGGGGAAPAPGGL